MINRAILSHLSQELIYPYYLIYHKNSPHGKFCITLISAELFINLWMEFLTQMQMTNNIYFYKIIDLPLISLN